MISKVVAGVGGLVLVFLLLTHGRAFVDIINSIGRTSIDAVRVLQGRG